MMRASPKPTSFHMGTAAPVPRWASLQAEQPITVLLIDDQAIIGETVRRMIADVPGLTFHFCSDPKEALSQAIETRPTVILQDLVMPEVDGLLLVKFLRAHPVTREIPLIVLSSKEDPIIKAEAFALGANDYLVKLPAQVELLARIQYHSRGYIGLQQRNAAFSALAASEKQLADEMAAAAAYVQSLLPSPEKSPLPIDWRYVPCAALGGDSLGYGWLTDDQLALYVLDVAGHGLASALLGVTVMNVIRSRSLPNTDFSDPGRVLAGLNAAFPMERCGEKCFTIWYGVYDRSSRQLRWSGAGHPAALLFEPDSTAATQLDSGGPMIGMMEWDDFEVGERTVPPGSALYLYSDGAHEIHKSDGSEWLYQEFLNFVTTHRRDSVSVMDQLLSYTREIHGTEILDDDFSIVEVML